MLLPPGKYRVTGTYRLDDFSGEQGTAGAEPISIEVKPRSAAEMRQYIDSLAARLPAANEKDTSALLKRLAYTANPQATAALVNALYRSEEYWAQEAFVDYIPPTSEVKSQIISAAKARGLAAGIDNLLERFEVSSEDRFGIIRRSFASPDPKQRSEAAFAAASHPDNRFTQALIELSKSSGAAQDRAIFALAANRTDESVRALKKLLADPDPGVRKTAEIAVRQEYIAGGYKKTGRPLRPTDFPAEFQTGSH